MIIVTGGAGTVAGQAMFLPSDENGAYVEGGHISSKDENGFGMSLGMAHRGFEFGFAVDFMGRDHSKDASLGLFASLDTRRLMRTNSAASVQFTAGVVAAGSSQALAFGPSVYLGTVNPIGWVFYVRCGMTVLRSFDSGVESEFLPDLGASLGYRSSGIIATFNYVTVIHEQVTTHSISLSLTFRKKKPRRFDEDIRWSSVSPNMSQTDGRAADNLLRRYEFDLPQSTAAAI